jgi:hypothetical protein
MNDVSFDTLARDTQAPQGRRYALKALGLAALGAVAATPLVAEAKNNDGGNNGNNNNKNKDKNRNRKRNRKQGRNDQECPPEDCTQEAQQAVATTCQAQVTQCEQQIGEFCRNDEDPDREPACLNAFLPCCSSLTTCNFAGYFTCFVQKLL